jgi:hypothetical protein
LQRLYYNGEHCRYNRPIATPDDFRKAGLELFLRNGTAYSDIAKRLNLRYTVSTDDARCAKTSNSPDMYGTLFEKMELMAQVVNTFVRFSSDDNIMKPESAYPANPCRKTDAALIAKS